VSEPGKLIAAALRGIAEQGVAPPQLAGAAWRAGRRRRLAVMATSAAAGAAAVAAAVLLIVAAGGPAHPQPAISPVQPAAPIQLQSPIQFRQVAVTGSKPCAAGSGGLAGRPAADCVYLTDTGMTITMVESANVIELQAGEYVLRFGLTPADASMFGLSPVS
jgi:hypothetical protein